MATAKSGPDSFWPRVTKFLIGGEEVILFGNTGVPNWPSTFYKLRYSVEDNLWSARQPDNSEPSFYQQDGMLHWIGEESLFGKRYVVLWRGPRSRNVFFKDTYSTDNSQTTYPVSASIAVNKTRRDSPFGDVYGVGLYRPTTGSLANQIQIIAVAFSGSTFTFRRCALLDFLANTHVWVSLSVTGTNASLSSILGTPPPVFFSQDGSRAVFVDATNTNDAFENRVQEVEYFLATDGLSVNAVRTIHGPWSISLESTGSIQQESIELTRQDVAGSQRNGAFFVGDTSFPVDVVISGNFDVPIGCDYVGGVKTYAYLRTSILYSYVRSIALNILSSSGDISTPPSGSGDTVQVTASSERVAETTIRDYRLVQELVIGSDVVAELSFFEFTGSYETRQITNWDSGTIGAMQHPDWPSPSVYVWDLQLTGLDSGIASWFDTEVEDLVFSLLPEYVCRGPAAISFLDIRTGSLVLHVADSKTGESGSNADSGKTDIFRKIDLLGSGVFCEYDAVSDADYRFPGIVSIVIDPSPLYGAFEDFYPTDPGDPPVVVDDEYEVPMHPPRTSLAVGGFGNSLNYNALKLFSSLPDTAIATKDGALLVVLDRTQQARYVTDRLQTTYLTGPQNLPEVAANTDFEANVHSLAKRQ